MSSRTLIHADIEIKESDFSFLADLEKKVIEILKKKKRVIIAVTGRPGCGKSTFGKFVRKLGFGSFSPRFIAVIDDDVMTKEHLFGIIRTKMKLPSTKRDNLAPFLKTLKKHKKIIFYINTFPYKRLEKADILLELTLDEDTRRKRLNSRVHDSEKLAYLTEAEVDTGNLQYSHRITGCTK